MSSEDMIALVFPDGTERSYGRGVTPASVAASIAPSLAKKALLARVDGALRDMTYPLTKDAHIVFLTAKDPDCLEVIRHDTAHVLAQAVQRVFPGTQITIGPVIADGFYYDFAREAPFSTDDFPALEAEMHRIIDANYPLRREVWPREKAISHFRDIGENFKAELIADLPEDEELTIYRQGEWMDLCRGPHLPSTGAVPKAFKLTKLAGSYWRGDSANPALQRIYGTAWAQRTELADHMQRLEEAEKRDHRRLGRIMDLFHLQPDAPGSVFWHEAGLTIWLAVESYLRRRLENAGYGEVRTPQLLDRELWERSGHWQKFRDNMFLAPDFAPSLDDDSVRIPADAPLLAIKPMNCPAHVQIFRHSQRSWRDLPLRMSEFGCCHRNETRGSLHGLMRVRQMTQDDGHIFCRQDQIASETVAFCDLLRAVYADFGFADPTVKLALRPQVRVGADTVWDKAEIALEQALKTTALPYQTAPEEGAFYGPKLEFHLTDAIGRSWQCGTLQLDFVMPERLGATYVDADGEKKHPIMLHRAIVGSLERFIGILIEHHAGAMPLWLAPRQVVVASITNDIDDYARHAAASLRAAGLRVHTDLRNEKITYKVREHSHTKIPVIAVAGHKEADTQSLSLRRLGSKGQDVLPLAEAVTSLAALSVPPDLAREQAETSPADVFIRSGAK